MGNDKADLVGLVADLARTTLTEQMRAAQRFNEFVGRIGRDRVDGQAMLEDSVRFAREEASSYVTNVANLSLGYYKGLLELNRDYNTRFFQQVTPPTPREAASPPEQVSAPCSTSVKLGMRGTLGGEASGSFVVGNKRDEVAETCFLTSEFIGGPATSPFRPPLEIQPPRLTLKPGQEQEVTIRLQLAPELFAVGEYQATLVVHGFEDRELLLVVTVEPPDCQRDPAAGTPAAKSMKAVPASQPRRSRRKSAPVDPGPDGLN